MSGNWDTSQTRPENLVSIKWEVCRENFSCILRCFRIYWHCRKTKWECLFSLILQNVTHQVLQKCCNSLKRLGIIIWLKWKLQKHNPRIHFSGKPMVVSILLLCGSQHSARVWKMFCIYKIYTKENQTLQRRQWNEWSRWLRYET